MSYSFRCWDEFNLYFPGFTGIDQAYEEPVKPEIVIEAGELTLEESSEKLVTYLQERVSIYVQYT